MGRPPSKNPKAVHLGIRIEPEIDQALQAEIDRFEREHGVVISKSEMIRKILKDALSVRAKRK
jgi:hypothetical protein